jgi:hypothetical protein
VQDRLLALYHQRVPGVVTALEANDCIRFPAQQINDLSFTFVAPLGAENYDAVIHECSMKKL